MVVDTSALVAILLREADAETYVAAIAATPIRLLSAVTRVELAFVIEGRKRGEGRKDLEALLHEADFEVAMVTPNQVNLAIDAFRRYGKGRHPAALNIGDCFSYALAAATGHKLLFKGRDFAQTDIEAALA